MEYGSIAEILSESDAVRDATQEFVSGISVEESEQLADGEKWTLRHLFEHVSLVDASLLKLIAMLAAKSERSDAAANTVSDDFTEMLSGVYSKKLEAPDRVQPTGEIPVDKSLLSMEESRRDLAAMGEQLEGTNLMGLKYPHPYFGEMTAPEWMVLRNKHEVRHLDQARVILEKIRQK
ncbi:MAG TPA: DinB family protein [Pyrinomonadaceae bacterium]|nr:DinB family protein [Pyrinomonadaceae bacterium]